MREERVLEKERKNKTGNKKGILLGGGGGGFANVIESQAWFGLRATMADPGQQRAWIMLVGNRVMGR